MTPELLLAHLRCARRRAQLAIVEIDCIGLSLTAQNIGVDDALLWLADIDALRFLLPPDSEAAP